MTPAKKLWMLLIAQTSGFYDGDDYLIYCFKLWMKTVFSDIITLHSLYQSFVTETLVC